MTKKSCCFFSVAYLLELCVCASVHSLLASLFCRCLSCYLLMRRLLVPVDTWATIFMKDANLFLRFNKYWLLWSNIFELHDYEHGTTTATVNVAARKKNACLYVSSTTTRTPNKREKSWTTIDLHYSLIFANLYIAFSMWMKDEGKKRQPSQNINVTRTLIIICRKNAEGKLKCNLEWPIDRLSTHGFSMNCKSNIDSSVTDQKLPGIFIDTCISL